MRLVTLVVAIILTAEGVLRFRYELRKFDSAYEDADVFATAGAFVEFAVGIVLLGSALSSGAS